MDQAGDTIAAVATPPGRGGIGIVRISGPRCREIAQRLTGAFPVPRRAGYHAFHDAAGEILDRGLLLYFPAPASYTGEDVLELHAHGSPALLRLLLERVLELGARRARPGEFTERAFLNGKLDLAQAEAVADLIDSASGQAARSAMRSLEGAFSRDVRALVEALINLRVAVEGMLDFPQEDIERQCGAPMLADIDHWLAALERLAARACRGRRLREGLRVVILGRPNVGKSSLLNRLAAADRAIVDATPGTTRDTLEERLLIGGIQAHLVDTAGVRAAGDAVEAEGVRRSWQAAEDADVILLVTDTDTLDDELAARLPEGRTVLYVRNKIDLADGMPRAGEHDGRQIIALSAKTGAGIDLLLAALESQAQGEGGGEDAILARDRHLEALAAAAEAMRRGRAALEGGRGVELFAEELRAAQAALGSITGEFGADELLGEIFARFCIGK